MQNHPKRKQQNLHENQCKRFENKMKTMLQAHMQEKATKFIIRKIGLSSTLFKIDFMKALSENVFIILMYCK